MTVAGGDLSRLRDRMVTSVTASGRPVSDAVTAAMRAVPRHLFLPELPPEMAYRNEAIVTRRGADGQPTSSSSQPTIMAYMLDQLRVGPGQRVLEIGAGTGYNAALLQQLVGAGGRVVTVDLDDDVARQAAAHLARAGYPEVTVVQADGAAGYPAGAPYDRIIATVGVSDLAPAWLDQLVPGGRVVVPLDLRGSQRSVALEWDGACWQSRSVVPCGFMRMRGTLAGPERTVVSGDSQELALTLPGGRDLDITAVARALADPAGPAAERATRVTAGPAQLFDGLGLWLALNEPRWGMVSESARIPGGLARAPISAVDRRITAGVFDTGGFAILARPSEPDSPKPAPAFELSVLGYGPAGPDLAAELTAQVQAWDAAGRPGTGHFRISAYPARPGSAGSPGSSGSSGSPGGLPGGAVIERPHTTFVVRAT